MRMLLCATTALLILMQIPSAQAQPVHCAFDPHMGECATSSPAAPPAKARRTAKKPRRVAARGTRVAAMAASASAPSWLHEAQKWIGARARDLGVRPTLWCAAGLNKWLRSAGLQGTNSDAARSFASYGKPTTAQPGAIAVMKRGRNGGHVGIVVSDLGSSVRIIAANQSNRVSYGVYSKRQIYAFRWPASSSGGLTSKRD